MAMRFSWFKKKRDEKLVACPHCHKRVKPELLVHHVKIINAHGSRHYRYVCAECYAQR